MTIPLVSQPPTETLMPQRGSSFRTPLRMRVMHATWLSILFLLPLLGGLACSSPDLSGPVSPDPTQLPWRLDLSAHAITMSTATPYDTLQLTAVVRTVEGVSLVNASAITFESSDSSVRVSATGLLTARHAASSVPVVGTFVYQNVRLVDTAFVTVTTVTNPPVFRYLQVELQPGDSAKIAVPTTAVMIYYRNVPRLKKLQIGAQDSTGTRIANSLVELRSPNVMQVGISSGKGNKGNSEYLERLITATTTLSVNVPVSTRLGDSVTVYASATVYGVTLVDSLKLLITPQLMFIFTIHEYTPSGSQTPIFELLPDSQHVIAVGGYAWWWNNTSDSLDIVFDDPTVASPDPNYNSGGGNIDAFPGGDFNLSSQRSRQFLQAGSFHWHNPRTGVSGTIIVR